MKAFRIAGHYPASKKNQTFTIDFVASDEEDAKHRLFSHIGSRHRVQRRHITIESIDQIDPSTSSSPHVIHAFRDTPTSSPSSIDDSEE
ncbi:MAG: 50S ribosomal protein L18Ae [Candidatus Thermoplasmatota archaeon]|nr:50S ribosomal protein L18Ae [Candidatus Thermoplasmatota archaeon]